MDEDIQLTYQILEYFKDLRFPVCVTAWDLENHFPNVDPYNLHYHIYLATQYGLLSGNVDIRFDSSGASIQIGELSGLTIKGRNYVNTTTKIRQQAHDGIVSDKRLPYTDSIIEEIERICDFVASSRYLDQIVEEVLRRLKMD